MIKKQIPCENCLDHTLMFLREGYLFIPERIKRYRSEVFETRLLGRRVICMSGKEAARLFYNAELFEKRGALPKRVQRTLFGLNGIQTMDGARHMYRKRFFMSFLTPEAEKQLGEITLKKLEKAAAYWQKAGQVVLLDELNVVLCQAVCEWAGVPLQPEEERCRAQDFEAMINSFASVGPKYWRGKLARKRTEKWIQELIEDVRSGRLCPEKGSVLYKMAFYREGRKRLDSKMAAIELMNVLRPTVAVSRFIVFSVIALFEHGEYREKLLTGEEELYEAFAKEVRRCYPFAPCLGGIVKKDFRWKGYHFRKKTLVILDLYGTNHDFRIWEKPDKFWPERFLEKPEGAFEYIPQGGGSPSTGHRCPGEGVTIELMKVSLDFLLHRLDFKIPVQNLSYSLRKIPTEPESGLLIKNVRLI